MLIDTGKLAGSLGVTSSVDYVFEDGAGGRGALRKIAEGVLDHEPARGESRMSSVTFRDKSAAGLQAADILAYELHKQLPRQLGLETRAVRYPLTRLAALPGSWGWLNLDELRKWHWVLGTGLHHGEGRWNR